MGKIEVTGLDQVKPQEPLANGRYTVSINRKEILNKDNGKITLSVGMVVMEGPTQPDQTPSEDRRISDFFPLNKYETMKDGGTYSKQKLAAMLAAAEVAVDETGSFDDDELIGKVFDITTKIKDDQDGVPQANVVRYLPRAE